MIDIKKGYWYNVNFRFTDEVRAKNIDFSMLTLYFNTYSGKDEDDVNTF